MSLNESTLNDSDPVYAGRNYIAVGIAIPDLVAPVYESAGVVVTSTITGLVSDLATLLGASAIRACDLIGRSGAFPDSGKQIFE